jgi:hypothetical protein
VIFIKITESHFEFRMVLIRIEKKESSSSFDGKLQNSRYTPPSGLNPYWLLTSKGLHPMLDHIVLSGLVFPSRASKEISRY